MGRPLEGLSFLELGDTPSTAYAGRLLILLGATVTKVVDAALSSGRHPPLDAGKAIVVRDDTTPELVGRLPVAGALVCGPAIRADFPVVSVPPDPDPLTDWAASGAMALTGQADGQGIPAPGRQASYLRGAALAAKLLVAIARDSQVPEHLAQIDGPEVLGERAAPHGRLGGGGGALCVR